MRKLVFLFILTLILLIGCVSLQYIDKKYDYNYSMVEKGINLIRKVEASTYSLEIRGIVSAEGAIFLHVHKAIAFSLDGKHLVVLKHTVDLPKQLVFPPFPFPIPVEEVEKHVFLDDKELKVISNDSDIALVYDDEGREFNILPIEVGDSDELEMGMVLVSVRTPAMLGFGISRGVVSNLQGYNLLKEDKSGEDPRHVFMLTSPTNPGDSGCPVFTLRDGKPELIGIVQGKINPLEEVGWAIKINYVIEQIKDLLRLKESE